ncbi:MAG: SLC13 family permease [Actinobacteria bacterium]|nr:SLC13 family permease [Actinomycetota bacterium]
MTFEAGFTLATLMVTVAVLTRELMPPAVAVLSAVVVLLLVGVVDAAQAFAGFSNPATLTVAALLVVSRAAQTTGTVERLLGHVLGADRSDRRVLRRLVPAVATSSAVIANTPIVAMLAPTLRTWAERARRPPSRFLMPLSFAAILGGLITTIGTSVTLLVSGLSDEAGVGAFGLFEITPLGLPIAVAGCAVLALLAPRVLPDRRSPHEQLAEHGRDYTFAMQVEPGGVLDGRDVRSAGLRSLAGVYLVRIERDGHEIAPVAPDAVLYGGDVLTFVGQVDHVRDLRALPGLKSAEEGHVDLLDEHDHRLFEVVVGAASRAAGRTPKEISFRGRYGAAIVAIHRAGAPVRGKLGEVRIRPGDALLLLADRDFADRWSDRRDFLLIVPVDAEPPKVDRRAWFVLIVLAAMVVAAASGALPLLHAALAAVVALLVTRVLSVPEARQALDLDLLLLIAGAIGLGGAVQASGLAGGAAEAVTGVATAVGPVGALVAVLIATLMLTELVTNAAAAALMVPVALGVAARIGSDPQAFAVVVAVGASASFLTPIGYQTNTMVHGLGGYRFGDYWRLGLPLTAVVIITTVLVTPLIWAL